ncbi:hypothetical protein [Rhizobium sp. Root1203]|uniref:hypothetical protein n=1 Tax=Rhizobium sp. Root1203 TaxID=1736427 RepID=UPI0012E39BF6|nr:hypothetical protein [Rhizobium sp. Root1203]
MNNTKGVQADKAGATITLTHDSLNAIALCVATLDKAKADGSVKVMPSWFSWSRCLITSSSGSTS